MEVLQCFQNLRLLLLLCPPHLVSQGEMVQRNSSHYAYIAGRKWEQGRQEEHMKVVYTSFKELSLREVPPYNFPYASLTIASCKRLGNRIIWYSTT